MAKSSKSKRALLLPDGTKMKWPASTVPGVFFRGDSARPRWEVKVRWTNAEGNRESRTLSHHLVDLSAKTGTAEHIDTARHAAESYATRALAKLKGQGATAASSAPDVQTLESWLRRYMDELERSQLLPGHPERPEHPIDHKGWSQEMSLLRTLLGEAKGGANRGGFPELTRLRIAEVDAEQVVDGLRAAMKGRHGAASNSSIKKALVLLSLVYNRAAQEWRFKVSNPFADLKNLLKRKGLVISDARDVVITPAEFRTVMRHMRHAHIATKAAINFDLGSSCRRGEAVKLDWQQVDWSGDIVTATFLDTKSKTGKPRQRTIPVLGKALAALRAMALLRNYEDTMGCQLNMHSHRQPPLVRPSSAQWARIMAAPPVSGPVFRVRGRRLRADTITQAWGRARVKAATDLHRPVLAGTDLAKVRVHDLRHTATTHLVDEGGLSSLAVAALVGHTNIQTTNRYYHGNAKRIGATLKSNLRNARVGSVDEEKLAESLKRLPQDALARVLAKVFKQTKAA